MKMKSFTQPAAGWLRDNARSLFIYGGMYEPEYTR